MSNSQIPDRTIIQITDALADTAFRGGDAVLECRSEAGQSVRFLLAHTAGSGTEGCREFKWFVRRNAAAITRRVNEVCRVDNGYVEAVLLDGLVGDQSWPQLRITVGEPNQTTEVEIPA